MPNQAISIQERISEYRMILIYRWRFIALVTIGLFAVFFVAVLVMPNVYEATTAIVAYPRRVPERYVPSAVVDDPSDRLNLLQQEILSYTRLAEVIRQFGLYDKVVRNQGENAAVQLMRKKIKIQTTHASSSGASAFTITFSGGDPKVVASVANELARGFIKRNLSNRQQEVQDTSNFLVQELDSARTDLEKQEAHLSAYRMSHLGEMPEQMTGNLQAIGQLQVQFQSISDKIAQLDQEKLLLENSPDSDPSLRALTTQSPDSLLRDELRQEQQRRAALLTHETILHPDVIGSTQKIAELKRQLAALPSHLTPVITDRPVRARLQIIDGERSRLAVEQATIRQRLNSYQTKVDAVPLRQEQLSGLTRDYQTDLDHYRSLLEGTFSAEMASELEAKQESDRFEVLDPAIPPDRPTAPNRRLLWGVSALLALIGGIVAASGREQMDSSIKSEAELLRILSRDLELVGTISTILPLREHQRRRLLTTS